MLKRNTQHTLKKSVRCTGVGVHSGEEANLTIRPAEADTGILFIRTDVTDKERNIPAHWDNVVDTRMCTVLGNKDGVTISTVEHLMAALRGCGVDNAIVKIDGPEIPIMDGSSGAFVDMIEKSGLEDQKSPRKAIRIKNSVVCREENKETHLTPADGCFYSFEIEFASKAIGKQDYTVQLMNGNFRDEISKARTFGFLHEVEALQKLGLAKGGSLDNAIVIDQDKVLNKDGLRYENEFVRHKILDAVGDLYLAGMPIIGHFHGIRSGHDTNNKILKELFADEKNWEVVILEDQGCRVCDESTKNFRQGLSGGVALA